MTPSNCCCEATLGLADAAADVIETWAGGDLAAAVQALDQALKDFDSVHGARRDGYPAVEPSGVPSGP